jgi:hypothetical protein
MNKLLIPFLLIAWVYVFSSCQKKIATSENPDMSKPSADDSIFLLKYIEIDSLGTTLFDTSLTMEFSYDAQKRLLSIHTVHSTDSIANLTDYDNISFLYNGSDTFPVKSLRKVQKGTDPATYLYEKDTAYFVYDAMRRLTADSTVYDRIYNSLSVYYYSTNKYTYAAGFSTDLNSESVSWNTSVNYWLDSNFNISSNNNINTLHSARYNFPDLAPTQQVLNFNFSYDNHPNPFFKIPALHAASPIFKYGEGPLYVLGRNNATSILQQAPFGAGFTEDLIYEYGNNGYPSIFYSTFTQHYDAGGPSIGRNYKAIFVYSNR